SWSTWKMNLVTGEMHDGAAHLTDSVEAARSAAMAAARAAIAAARTKGDLPARKRLPLSAPAVATRPIATAKLSCAAMNRTLISGTLHIAGPRKVARCAILRRIDGCGGYPQYESSNARESRAQNRRHCGDRLGCIVTREPMRVPQPAAC